METFDTNVLVRLLVSDDKEQCERAERAWRSAVAGDGVFIPLVVLVELVWVLRSAYKFDRVTIAGTLRRLCNSKGVFVQNAATIFEALEQYEQGGADFSDYLILETARRAGALPVRTFDERLATSANVEPV